jgi:nucleoside-diphosphate-sugar epimerase
LFNCIGIGDKRALSDGVTLSGDLKLGMSHVVPDLVQKVLKGQNPIHILGQGDQVRHYTYGGDLAQGIRICIESEKAINQDFNLSTAVPTTVLELAEAIWQKINPGLPFAYVSDPPFQYDVQKSIPSVEKARRLLGFEATTTLSQALDEIIPWVRQQIEAGNI